MSLLRDLALPPDATTRAAAWVRAEAAGDDLTLLALRELEQACAGLPPTIDGARRTRLLAADAIATTWEAWRSRDGARVLLRCLQPRWVADPVLRRRFARTAAADAHMDGDWPHLSLACPGSPVIDHLPVEDPPATSVLARLLAAGLQTLAPLHEAGVVHGGPIGALLVDGPDGARLAWLDGLAPGRSTTDDLRALGAVIATLDPDGVDPVGLLARSWAVDPPPCAADGLTLLRHCLAAVLLDQRHRLVMASRRAGRRQRATRLAAATRALAATLGPPPGRACLRATSDGLLTIIDSDGRTVRGGVAARADTDQLPAVYSARTGLHPQAARSLMRAWATRSTGDEATRQAHQEQLGGTDQQADQLVRWLRAIAALRRASLLAGHVSGSHLAAQSSATVTR